MASQQYQWRELQPCWINTTTTHKVIHTKLRCWSVYIPESKFECIYQYQSPQATHTLQLHILLICYSAFHGISHVTRIHRTYFFFHFVLPAFVEPNEPLAYLDFYNKYLTQPQLVGCWKSKPYSESASHKAEVWAWAHSITTTMTHCPTIAAQSNIDITLGYNYRITPNLSCDT